MSEYKPVEPGEGSSELKENTWEVWFNGEFYQSCESKEHAFSLSADLNLKALLRTLLRYEDDRLAIRLIGKEIAKIRALVKQSDTGKLTLPSVPSTGLSHS